MCNLINIFKLMACATEQQTNVVIHLSNNGTCSYRAFIVTDIGMHKGKLFPHMAEITSSLANLLDLKIKKGGIQMQQPDALADLLKVACPEYQFFVTYLHKM